MFTSDLLKKFYTNSKGKYLSHDRKKNKWPRTQDLEELYIINSAGFLSSKKNYFRFKDRLCDNAKPYISRINSGFDIDDKNDFDFFEKYLIKNIRPI